MVSHANVFLWAGLHRRQHRRAPSGAGWLCRCCLLAGGGWAPKRDGELGSRAASEAEAAPGW